MLHTVSAQHAQQDDAGSKLAASSAVPSPVEWRDEGAIRLVDQTRLPHSLDYIDCRTIEGLADAVLHLKVRGAPAIGIAVAYGLALAAHLSPASDSEALLADLQAAAGTLRATRPTAVNLPWALAYVMEQARSHTSEGAGALRRAVLDAARQIEELTVSATVRIGQNGAELLPHSGSVLTHCNTGPLACGGIGTALGVIYTAHEGGKQLHVWVDETRPLLQGARLTTWELGRWAIPHTLIADNMAASIMRAGKVQAVLVGADRIAANGDVANKIGTYGVAVLARAHNVPFYVVAPSSTIDLATVSGEQIHIEERAAHEVTHHGGRAMAPEGCDVYNPAFDVTPAALVSSIITEFGVAHPPYTYSKMRQIAGEEGRITA